MSPREAGAPRVCIMIVPPEGCSNCRGVSTPCQRCAVVYATEDALSAAPQRSWSGVAPTGFHTDDTVWTLSYDVVRNADFGPTVAGRVVRNAFTDAWLRRSTPPIARAMPRSPRSGPARAPGWSATSSRPAPSCAASARTPSGSSERGARCSCRTGRRQQTPRPIRSGRPAAVRSRAA